MCYAKACHPRHGRRHRRHQARKWWKHKFAAMYGFPPVNVEEQDNQYLIQLFAAGYAKGDFKISLEDNLLKVAATKAKSKETHDTHKHWNPSNFKPGNFERYFELNEKINKEGISAKYEEGVLTVTLPKVEGAETQRQEINVG